MSNIQALFLNNPKNADSVNRVYEIFGIFQNAKTYSCDKNNSFQYTITSMTPV